jgi:hypothetical protein
MKHELRCSVCGEVAATFAEHANAAIYVGVLGKHLRTERVAELRVVRAAGVAAIERFMKDGGWREMKADDVTPAYTIGDDPIFTLDAYCSECDRVYCKAHMTTRASAHAGYGEWIVATCPLGHERKVYDDPR